MRIRGNHIFPFLGFMFERCLRYDSVLFPANPRPVLSPVDVAFSARGYFTAGDHRCSAVFNDEGP